MKFLFKFAFLSLFATYVNSQSAPLRNAPQPNQPVIRLTPIYQGSVAADIVPYFAVVRNSNGDPLINVPVNFMITNGPDMGKVSTVFSDCNGRAQFDYLSPSKIGSETTIVASCVDTDSGAVLSSQESELYVFSLPTSYDPSKADEVARKAAEVAAGKLSEANGQDGEPISVESDVVPESSN